MLYTDADKIAKEEQSDAQASRSSSPHLDGLNKMFDDHRQHDRDGKGADGEDQGLGRSAHPIYLHTLELGPPMKRQDAYKYYFVDADGGRQEHRVRATIQKLVDFEQKLSEEETAKDAETYQNARLHD